MKQYRAGHQFVDFVLSGRKPLTAIPPTHIRFRRGSDSYPDPIDNMRLIDVDIVILQDLSVVDFRAIVAIAPFGDGDVVVEAHV
ncbi:hypothetical protein [Rhizobium leguminosarum]|uniref:hypothetical protein n=1 Tax=Rhizobium leguminosarum TaxID=384 RepID=UPI0013EED4EE|nr:hypothetical protein [Rhizobium leguminosarum]